MTAAALSVAPSAPPYAAAREARLRRLAVALAAAGALVVLGGGALAMLNAGTVLPEGTDWRAAGAGAVAFLAAGALLAVRLPANPLSWVALVVGMGNAVSLGAGEYAVWALLTEPGAPGGAWAQWVAQSVWMPAYLLVPTLLLLLFPDGRPPTPRWRPLVPVTLTVVALFSVAWALTPYAKRGEPVVDPSVANPVAAERLAGALDTASLLLPVCVVLCVASVVVRVRRGSGVERQQLRWFGAGVAATLTLLAAGQASDALAPAALGLALAVLPATVAVAVLRHGLWELGPLARRSAVYAALSAAVLGVYGLATLVLGGGEVIATAVVAVALMPVRDRLERTVNRLLYGDRDEPWAAVRKLGERLAAPQTTADAAHEVARLLRLPRVAIIDADADAAMESGDIHLPLMFHGEPVGTLVAGGRELGAADRRALAELAPHLAAAVHAARLTEDLRRSRERLVTAREEERRRLRHDLHDDLGPSLAMLALRLDDAARELTPGPEGERMLRDLAGQARDGLAHVRTIVRDLRPAALDHLGLLAALAEQVDALGRGGLDARLQASSRLGPLPAATEVAAYRIAREAMNNVVRHAGARSCTVTVAREDGSLRVAVSDDGRGIPSAAQPGLGLASMAARADELGGTLTIEGTGGGTRVEARLPL